MAEKSSFFNSVSGDRKYSAEDWAAYFSSFIGNGVYANPSNALQVLASSGMGITIKAGSGFINGYYYRNTTDLSKTISVADGVLSRIDRVVLRWSLINRTITVEVLQGAYANTPTAIAVTRNAETYELALADIYIRAGVTAIVQSDITDRRHNNSLCGIVTGVIDQYDFETLTSQFNSFCNEFQTDVENWFSTVQGVLSGDVAGNLLTMINTKADAQAMQTALAAKQDKITASGILKGNGSGGVSAVTILKQLTATIGTAWTGSAAPFSQNVTVSGLLVADKPIVDVVPSATFATAKSQLEQWAKIYRIVTANNQITVYALEKTTVSIPIQLVVNRT